VNSGVHLVRSYGRRRGRKLRAGQQRLLVDWLPRFALPADESQPIDPAGLFAPPRRALWLEVGFGSGEHLVAQARSRPEVGFIGCEPFVNGAVALLAAIRAHELANIRLWTGDVRRLLPRLPAGALARVFVLYPDPWPKTRHHKRRLVETAFLDALARAMAPGAELRLATDHAGYLAWMLERLTAHPAFLWTARRPADWRSRPADQPATRYEARARAAGRICTYLCFVRR
jgi:tRNA (guanine-N7-)-methyltransferase